MQSKHTEKNLKLIANLVLTELWLAVECAPLPTDTVSELEGVEKGEFLNGLFGLKMLKNFLTGWRKRVEFAARSERATFFNKLSGNACGCLLR